MKVKAKWSVKDATGWHDAGEVFETESDLGDAVEVLEAKKAKKHWLNFDLKNLKLGLKGEAIFHSS